MSQICLILIVRLRFDETNQLIQNISSFFQIVAMVTKLTNLEQKSHDSMVKTIVLAHFLATVYSYLFDTQKQSLCTINI